MLFDLPLQTICKMVVDKGTEEDIEANENLLAQQQSDLAKAPVEDSNTQSPEPGGDFVESTEPEIESIWEDKTDEYAGRTNTHSRSRSYSPLWKKDEEPHSWGFDEDQTENVDNVDATNDKNERTEQNNDSEDEHSENDEEDDEDDEESESSADSVRRG